MINQSAPCYARAHARDQTARQGAGWGVSLRLFRPARLAQAIADAAEFAFEARRRKREARRGRAASAWTFPRLLKAFSDRPGASVGCMGSAEKRAPTQSLTAALKRSRAGCAGPLLRRALRIFPAFSGGQNRAGCADDGPRSTGAHRGDLRDVESRGPLRPLDRKHRATTSEHEIGSRAILEQSRARSSWLFSTG